MAFDVLKLLSEEGYINSDDDNIVHAEKAFFAARVMRWIRDKVATDPEFNLTAYLTMLMYYKTGMADLKFSEDGDKIFYKMTNPEHEVKELVDSLIKSSREDATQILIDTIEGPEDEDTSEEPNRDPEP